MRTLLGFVMYLPKRVVLAHYVVLVNLTTPRSRMDEIERRCMAMHQRMFGENR